MRTVTLLLALSMAGWAQQKKGTPNPAPKPGWDEARLRDLQKIVPLTTAVREDDHPAIAERNGKVWIAWVSYSETDGTSLVYARSWSNGVWSAPIVVSESPGDYYKPGVTVAEDGAVWVAWPAQVGGNWDIYGRVNRGGVWGKTERWTGHAGPDTMPQLASARGRVLLVWQGLRGNNLDILYRIHQNGAWGPEGFVTTSPASDWAPVVAATRAGVFHVAWDSYRADYDVMLRSLGPNGWGPEMAVASSPSLENHASLAVDGQDRLWVAFEVGPEKWASDSSKGGLRPRRDVGLACVANGRVLRARTAETALGKLAGAPGMQAPALAFHRDGGVRLLYRLPVSTNWLQVMSTVWTGHGWAPPEPLLMSEGRIDQRIGLARAGDKLLAVYPAGSRHSVLYGHVYEWAGVPAAPIPLDPADNSVKAAPARPVRHTFGGYQLVWGDLHRHTDISEDGGIYDGSLLDTMRYSVDAAELDFIGITDHTRYLPRRYNLWRIQQITDLFYKPGAFSPMHSYERSQFSPWGHRNVVHLDRNYVPVPAGYDPGDLGVDPNGLFAALRGKRAISIPHTSAWGNKQVSWAYNDPDIERLVEIYQGCRSTYEYKGAPDPKDLQVYEEDSPNFVWNALEKKLKLGFIASSDHGSTHMSFAAVYVKSLDRPGIFEGLRGRRTYAATDKILVDFAIGLAIMGGETVVTGKPELRVMVEGTGPIAQIDVVRNGTFAYATKPGVRRAQFTFRDERYSGDDSFYYVRVIQQDKNMAWASPIWVHRRK
jgi:hypothetical protein